MKKVVVLIAGLALCSGAFAQKTVTWGVKAGMNVSNISEKYSGTIEEGASASDYETGYKSRVGFMVGVTADVRLSESFYLKPALQFTRFGAKTSESESFEKETYSMESTTGLGYLQVPVLASYRIALSDKVKWEINVGPYISVGLGGKIKRSETYNGEKENYPDIDAFGKSDLTYNDETDEETGTAKGNVQRFDAGLSFGTGVSFGKLYVGVNYDLGLSNIIHNDLTKKGSEYEHYKAHNRNFGVSVGFRF